MESLGPSQFVHDSYDLSQTGNTHSWIGHYFFSYLLTCEVYLIEVLGIIAQIQQIIIF